MFFSRTASGDTEDKSKASIDKTGIVSRLDKAVAEREDKAASSLVVLTKEYHDLRSRLKKFIATCTKYQKAADGFDEARIEMAESLVEMSLNPVESPLHAGVSNKDLDDSMISVYKRASKQAKTDAEKFKTTVLQYAADWEKVITTKADAELKENKTLKSNMEKYESKVETLRKKVRDVEAKGKEPTKDTKEKLERNEEKLKEAWKEHDEQTRKLCILLEEISCAVWKDLYPLVKAIMKFENERSSNDACIFNFDATKARLSTTYEKCCESWKASCLDPE